MIFCDPQFKAWYDCTGILKMNLPACLHACHCFHTLLLVAAGGSLLGETEQAQANTEGVKTGTTTTKTHGQCSAPERGTVVPLKSKQTRKRNLSNSASRAYG